MKPYLRSEVSDEEVKAQFLTLFKSRPLDGFEAENKIRKAEENIEKNLNDQDEIQAELIKQKEVLDMIVEKFNNIGKN